SCGIRIEIRRQSPEFPGSTAKTNRYDGMAGLGIRYDSGKFSDVIADARAGGTWLCCLGNCEYEELLLSVC
ncbi:MAG TPA: hypothetical protein VMU77_02795, partial [Acidimicrobiales bacterium]|nr:hypothetical protein [Acidimicrobiales bacterium]